MRYSLILAGAAAVVVASPAPSAIDLGAVAAAAAPSLVGPPVASVTQTSVYNANVASSTAAAQVTGLATASATASVAPSANQKRGFCLFGIWGDCGSKSTTSCTTSTTSTSTPCKSTTTTTPAQVTTTPGSTTTTAPSTITSAPSSSIVPSTCTPISWTNTNAFTSASACPSPFEVGTYCGFINPEDPCAPQPLGLGPAVLPDTVDAFKAFALFHTQALTAKTPAGYANTFKDLNASVNANSYMGLITLTSYDVAGCSAWCDNTTLCTGFNIYAERDPAWNPDQCSCTNPTSVTNYKCTLWGSGVEPAAANNFGQTRDDFQVVIAGSNGYEKTNTTTPVTPPGWTNPKNCSGSVHNHPSTCLGQKFFPGPFDPSVCSAYVLAQNSKNSQLASSNFFIAMFQRLYASFGYSPMKCNFFNAFMIKENGVAQGTYCSLFTQQYDPKYATYSPGWSNGNFWGVESSWSYCLSS